MSPGCYSVYFSGAVTEVFPTWLISTGVSVGPPLAPKGGAPGTQEHKTHPRASLSSFGRLPDPAVVPGVPIHGVIFPSAVICYG